MAGWIHERAIARRPFIELLQRRRVESVHAVPPCLLASDQPGVPEDPQVLRDRWLRHLERAHELVDGPLGLEQQVEQRATRWVRNGAEDVGDDCATHDAREFI